MPHSSTDDNFKSTIWARFFLAVRTYTRFCFRQSRLLVSLYSIVCLFVSCSCSRTKAAASILPLSKTFQRARCIADANQRIKGMLQADKEGLMPTSKPLTTITGDLPASLAQCKTKWRRAARYHNMAALSEGGHCLVTWRKGKAALACKYEKRKKKKSMAVTVIPVKECYFVFANVSTNRNFEDNSK